MIEEPRLDVRPDSAPMVRALGMLYICAPTIGVICLLLPHSPAAQDWFVALMAVIGYAMAPILFKYYRRMSPGAVGLLIALANSLITAAVYFDHEATSYYAWLYLYATPYAPVFFGNRAVFAHVAYVGVAYGVVLAAHAAAGNGAPGGGEMGHWIQVMAAIAVIVLLVRALYESLRINLTNIEAERRRRALEINDDVVQQLVLARQRYADDDRERGDASVAEALDRARRIMAEMIGPEGAAPGSLRRERAASSD